MTSDGLLVVQFIFSTIWRLFTSFEIPGTHATPAEFALFSISFVLAIRLLRLVLKLSGGDDFSSSSTRGSQSGPSSGSNYGGVSM